MGSKFVERETEVAGVLEVSIHSDYDSEGFIRSGLRWAPPMIRVDGRLAVAECVMSNITGGMGYKWSHRPGVRFGPGGRRVYVWVTEEVVEDILKACGWGTNHRNNKREQARAEQIAEFAMDLIEELS